jgi:hypothetical protein
MHSWKAHGAEPVNLDQFRTLEGSTATRRVNQGLIGRRLTNLRQLTLAPVDALATAATLTIWISIQIFNSLRLCQISPRGRTRSSPEQMPTLRPDKHIQAIANTAAFHMPTIEQGGNSLYPAMAQRASSVEVLRILISTEPTDKAIKLGQRFRVLWLP